MIPLIITTTIAVALLVIVSLVALWAGARESWYDKTLKRLWKDTKNDPTL